jgi:hypothetical protein
MSKAKKFRATAEMMRWLDEHKDQPAIERMRAFKAAFGLSGLQAVYAITEWSRRASK